MRLLVLVLLFSLSLFAKDTKKAIEVTNLKDGTSIIKINLNYEYTGKISHRIRGSNGSYGINIPIPGYWDVLSVNGYLSYNPSITLDKDTSSGAISLNDTVIKQFRLSDNSGTGIKFKVNPKYLKQYNWIKFEMFQHLTNSKANCDDSLRDDIWTEINLADSYLEFHIRKKPIPEQIDSLTTHMIDSKQYELEPINFVVSEDPTDEELRQYAMLSGAIANSLVYRIAPISVSKDIDFKKHNVIVTTRDKAKDRLAILDNYFFFDHNPLYAINFNSKNSNEVTVWSKDDSKKYSLNKNGITLTSKSAFFGKSLSLYGSKLKLTDLNLEAESEITVSFWFNANRVRGKSTLFSFDKYSLVLIKNSIGFSTGVKGLYGSKYRVKSGWHHIVATFSSTNIKKNKLFIDGKKLTLRKLFTKRRISMLPSFSSEIAIGGRVEDNKYKFKGLIDQVYIFTTSLEDSFVKKLYARSSRYKNMSYNESLFIVEKITHDINIIRNPVYQNKAILLISPKDSSKIDEVIYGFNKKDLSLYTYTSDAEIQSVGVTGLFLGYYFKWDLREVVEKSKKHGFNVQDRPVETTYENFENLDCYSNHLHDYLKYVKYGFGRATDNACLDIRLGYIDREQGVRLVNKYDGKYPAKAVKKYLEYTGFSQEEFDKIVDSYTNKRIFKRDDNGNFIRDIDNSLVRKQGYIVE